MREAKAHIFPTKSISVFGSISVKYRSTSISRIPREWRKHFELSEFRDKQIVTSAKFMYMNNMFT